MLSSRRIQVAARAPPRVTSSARAAGGVSGLLQSVCSRLQGASRPMYRSPMRGVVADGGRMMADAPRESSCRRCSRASTRASTSSHPDAFGRVRQRGRARDRRLAGREDLEQRRLAGAGASRDRGELALADVEREGLILVAGPFSLSGPASSRLSRSARSGTGRRSARRSCREGSRRGKLTRPGEGG